MFKCGYSLQWSLRMGGKHVLRLKDTFYSTRLFITFYLLKHTFYSIRFFYHVLLIEKHVLFPTVEPMWLRMGGGGRPVSAGAPLRVTCITAGARPPVKISWRMGDVPLTTFTSQVRVYVYIYILDFSLRNFNFMINIKRNAETNF